LAPTLLDTLGLAVKSCALSKSNKVKMFNTIDIKIFSVSLASASEEKNFQQEKKGKSK
jgi:hypothetical protein